MSGDQMFQRAILDWLEDGSDRTPRPAIDAVLLAVKTTRQQRGPWIPWRFLPMPGLTRATAVATMALLAVVGAGAALMIADRLRGPGMPSPSPTDVVSSAGPLTGLIAFVSDRDNLGGNPDIFVMNADGSGVRNLTNDPDDDATPAWSPDGLRIAYVRGSSAAGEVWLMNADGSDQRRLTNIGGFAWRPTWAPDGAAIAFADRATGAIYIIDADGSGIRAIIAADAPADRQPAWSPTGDLIAFTDERAVVVIQPDGTGRTAYAASLDRSLAFSMAAWAPDARQMAVVSPGMLGLASVNDGSSSWGRLTAEVGLTAPEWPAWSPDGRWIVFDADGTGSPRDIYVIRHDGTGLRKLTGTVGDDWAPAWR